MIRKITSRQDEEKKSRRNQIILGIILIALMFLSVLGYSFGVNTQKNLAQKAPEINYNGFTFAYFNGLWNVIIGNSTFSFINHPEQSYNVTSELKPLSSYYGQVLYLNSDNYDAEAEISRNFYQKVQSIRYACLENEKNCNEDFPVKTCRDNFIIIREKGEAEISQMDNCVFISGPKEELTKITDGFLLRIIGVK